MYPKCHGGHPSLKVVGDDSSLYSREAEKETDVAIVAPAQMLSSSTLPSGKVASLQKHFEAQKQTATLNSRKSTTIVGCVNGIPTTNGNSHTLTRAAKNKQPTAIDSSSGYDSLRTSKSNQSSDLDVRLAQALEENDEMFRTFDTLTRNKMKSQSEASDLNSDSSLVSSRIRNLNTSRIGSLQRQHSFPVSDKNESIETVPSPPPRILASSNSKVRSPSHILTVSSPSNIAPGSDQSQHKSSTSLSPTNSLSKSASHGDIAGHNSSSPRRQSQSNGSASTEDLRLGITSQVSPSKQSSIVSSNDSLTSSSSLVTVKSASLKSLDDDPPELPPRNITKSAMKPPLPRSASQVSS